jgi:hypothetical protein
MNYYRTLMRPMCSQQCSLLWMYTPVFNFIKNNALIINCLSVREVFGCFRRCFISVDYQSFMYLADKSPNTPEHLFYKNPNTYTTSRSV